MKKILLLTTMITLSGFAGNLFSAASPRTARIKRINYGIQDWAAAEKKKVRQLVGQIDQFMSRKAAIEDDIKDESRGKETAEAAMDSFLQTLKDLKKSIEELEKKASKK